MTGGERLPIRKRVSDYAAKFAAGTPGNAAGFIERHDRTGIQR